jgi:hypothetical protein
MKLPLAIGAVSAAHGHGGLCDPKRSRRAAASSLTLDAIAAPVADDSYSLQLTTAGTRTILSWIEGAAPDTTLKFAERTASGWSERCRSSRAARSS